MSKVKMKERVISKLVVVLILALTGCSAHIDECPVGRGLGCSSITEVNSIVSKAVVSDDKPIELRRRDSAQLSIEVIRIPEKVARIWVSSFEDESGDYIEETYVYTVLEGGKWVNVG